jgi:hypothetical protein
VNLGGRTPSWADVQGACKCVGHDGHKTAPDAQGRGRQQMLILTKGLAERMHDAERTVDDPAAFVGDVVAMMK